MTSTQNEKITTAQTELEKQVFDLPGVTGVSIGECEGSSCLNVMIEMEDDKLLRRIPKEINGIDVKVINTGVIGIQEQ